jgi:hypothetical protein
MAEPWYKNLSESPQSNNPNRIAKKVLWLAIHAKCKDCSVYSDKEVALCPVTDCSLYPYRFGKPVGRVAKRWLDAKSYKEDGQE